MQINNVFIKSNNISFRKQTDKLFSTKILKHSESKKNS